MPDKIDISVARIFFIVDIADQVIRNFRGVIEKFFSPLGFPVKGAGETLDNFIEIVSTDIIEINLNELAFMIFKLQPLEKLFYVLILQIKS